jgi:hypothetical protein
MGVTHDMDLLRYVVRIATTPTREYPYRQPTMGQMIPWCQQHLQGPYRLSWYNLSTIELRMATIEDHALVQLTWT